MNLIKALKLYLRVLAIGMWVSVLRHSDLQSSMIPWYLWQSFVITVSTTKWEVLWAATVFELRSSPRHFWGRPWSIQHSNTHAAETHLVQWIILIIHSTYRISFTLNGMKIVIQYLYHYLLLDYHFCVKKACLI